MVRPDAQIAIFGDFLRPVFPVSRVQHVSDLLVLVLVLVDVGHRSISFIVPHSSTSHNGS